MHKEHFGFLYGLVAALSASGMALFIKLSSSASIATLIFSRFVLGVPIVMWIIYRYKIPMTWNKVPKNLSRSLGNILGLYCYFFSLHKLPLVNAVTLTNTLPIFLPFLVLIWMKMVVSKLRFFAAALGFLGVIVLMRPTSDFVNIGSIMGLASGLFFAIAAMSVRILSKTENTETILAYYFLIGSVLTFFPVLFDWNPISEPIQWLYILCSAICALISQFTLTKAYTHAPATKVGTMSYMSVVFGGVLGWLVFGEVPDVWVLAGTILIISGAVMALLDPTEARPIKRD